MRSGEERREGKRRAEAGRASEWEEKARYRQEVAALHTSQYPALVLVFIGIISLTTLHHYLLFRTGTFMHT